MNEINKTDKLTEKETSLLWLNLEKLIKENEDAQYIIKNIEAVIAVNIEDNDSTQMKSQILDEVIIILNMEFK